jgi:hypothetical protein
MNGERWDVTPEGGAYRLSVPAADCNDPNTVGGCLIGGEPWLLVEQGVVNPLAEAAPKSTVILGGVIPTVPPTPTLTPTPVPPTETPTPAPITDTPQPTTEAAAVTPPPEVAAAPEATTEAAAQPPTEAVAAPSEPPTLTPAPSAEDLAKIVRPRGFPAFLPYLLMGIGALVIVGGVWFFIAGRKRPQAEPSAEPPAGESDQPAPRKRGGRRRKKRAPKEPPPVDEGDILDDQDEYGGA